MSIYLKNGSVALRGGGGVFVSSGAATDPYPWYTSFDRNEVPWHVGAGAWGIQYPLQAPTGPTTDRPVSVSSTSAFETEAAVSGSQITITSGWSELTPVNVGASDIDIVIPSGVSIGPILCSSTHSRIRIRGSTPGSHSGGRMGQVRMDCSDLIVDGIDINGASDFGSGESNQAFRIVGDRIAVVNCRAIAGGYLWLGAVGDEPQHVFFGNCNMFHGAATRAAMGYLEGEGIRNHGGPVTIVDTRIQGTRYHPIRVHSEGNAGELFYMKNSMLVAQAEGKLIWMWDTVPTGGLSLAQGAIIDGCTFYSYQNATCGGGPAEMSASDVQYSRVRNCTTYVAGASTSSQSYFDAQEAAGGGSPGDHDWSVNNTFSTFSSYPAWGGVGSPLDVPLPSGVTYADGEGVCPYGP